MGLTWSCRLLAPRADAYRESYTLTVAAADHCGAGLGEGHVPDQARIPALTRRMCDKTAQN